MEKSGFELRGHRGKWYVVESQVRDNETLYLVKSEDSDERHIVDENHRMVLENTPQGFVDYDYEVRVGGENLNPRDWLFQDVLIGKIYDVSQIVTEIYDKGYMTILRPVKSYKLFSANRYGISTKVIDYLEVSMDGILVYFNNLSHASITDIGTNIFLTLKEAKEKYNSMVKFGDVYGSKRDAV